MTQYGELTRHVRHNDDGTVSVFYLIDGATAPDLPDDLERDGLVKLAPNGTIAELIDPEHPRVVAFVIGVNHTCKANGWPEQFPGFEARHNFKCWPAGPTMPTRH
jgi:hypothetical protein